MLDTLSIGPVPGSPGVLPACAHPTLTSSVEDTFCVAASQKPLRWRSLKLGSGALRVILSRIKLRVVRLGRLYWTPTFQACSFAIPTAPAGGEAVGVGCWAP